MQAGTDLGQSGRLLFWTQPGRTNRKQRGALNINKTGYAFFLAVHAINCVGLRPWVYAFLRDDRMAFEAPRLSALLPPKRRAGNSRVISPVQWGVSSIVFKTYPGFRSAFVWARVWMCKMEAMALSIWPLHEANLKDHYAMTATRNQLLEKPSDILQAVIRSFKIPHSHWV